MLTNLRIPMFDNFRNRQTLLRAKSRGDLASGIERVVSEGASEDQLRQALRVCVSSKDELEGLVSQAFPDDAA